MLLGTLDSSLLGNVLIGRGMNRFGEGVVRAGYGHRCLRAAPLNSSKNKNMDF